MHRTYWELEANIALNSKIHNNHHVTISGVGRLPEIESNFTFKSEVRKGQRMRNLFVDKRSCVLTLALCALLASGCSRSLPDDGANAKSVHVGNMNRVRYIEIFVMGGDPAKGQMLGNVYNTTFIPGLDLKSDRDTAPQTYVESIDKDAIKKQFGAYTVAINGPKLWMLDWVDIPLGTSRDLNGKNIPWCATLHLTLKELLTMGKEGYKPTTIERKSKFGYDKGTQVFLIDDTEGTTWVMKGFELGMKPQYTFEQFAADPASYFKKLPQGWKVRTKVLDQDLIMVPETGIATIMPDELFNVYDKTGPGYSNYKP
jgi:hypothetical protein